MRSTLCLHRFLLEVENMDVCTNFMREFLFDGTT